MKPLSLSLRVALASSLLATGCTTSTKYRLAKPDTPPAVRLNGGATVGPLTLGLQSVIVFKGPGSWKREARWDEYVLTLANAGPGPLTVTAAELFDVTGQPQVAGTDPWVIERQSTSNLSRYSRLGIKVVLGAGAAVLYTAGSALVVSVAATGAIGTGAIVLLPLAPIAVGANLATVAVLNRSHRKKIEAEFDRRRLRLPVEIPAHESVEGSLFFPITPGPQRLVVHGQKDGLPFSLTLEIPALRQLHLSAEATR